MNVLPGPAQAAAICISATLPLLLFCSARFRWLGGAGRRFRIGCTTAVVVFFVACVTVPGERHFDDVLGGILLLTTAIMLAYVLWSLLAWGFTLTLLTALAQAGRPLTSKQWAAAYMGGGDLSTFAHNRLRLLLGSGMAVSSNGTITATTRGLMIVRLVRLVRLVTGLGSKP
jgi:hypothetical protein